MVIEIKAAFPIEWGREYYTVERKEKKVFAPCVACDNTGKITIKGEEYTCPRCKGNWREKEVVGSTTVYSVGKWVLVAVEEKSPGPRGARMARSALDTEEARAQFFFCHAYCSWERGSNENQNTMVRRRYPKGFDFADTTEEEIKALERWINNYPRGIFNYKSAAKMFQQEFGDLISLLL